jgi:hypothetical protein
MTSKINEFPLLKKNTVTRLLPLIDEQGVSLVSRGFSPSNQTDGGFLGAFYNGKLKQLATKNQTWLERRTGFIKRHWREGRRLYKEDGSPTRLHLALVAWAYSPDVKGLNQFIKKQGLKNRSITKFVIR